MRSSLAAVVWAAAAVATAVATALESSTRSAPLLFGVEELEHPFSALARRLCEMDESLEAHGPSAVRRALLALSLQSKAAKGFDGVAHSLATLGASAATGSSVAERLAAARDSSKKTSLRLRAAAAARASAVVDAFEALEHCLLGQEDASSFVVDDVLAVTCFESDDSEARIVLRWVGDAASLFAAIDAEVVRDGTFFAANEAFLRLARLTLAALSENDFRREEDDDEAKKPAVIFGHGGAGSVAALLAGLLGNKNRPVRAVCLGPAPCAARRHFPNCRVTTVVLGDDLVARASRGSLRRLRRRLRRFLPTKGRAGLGLFGMGAAVAASTIASLGDTVSTPLSADEQHTDEIRLRLPGHVFFLKPRADASVVVYALKTDTPKQGARADLLWQLNDLFLSKSMLAHHSLDAYLTSLDRS